MPQLDPTWFASQLFWLLVTFIALYFVLARLVLPPLVDVVSRRKQALDSDIANAERLKALAEKARLDYERMMAEARSRAQQLMHDVLADQKAKAEQSAREMNRRIEQQLAVASQRIATRKNELLAELAPAVIDLTAMIVEKLTQRTPASEQVQRAVGALSKNK